MRKINKKGVELSMNVIIIAILAILVLVILALFFTGGIKSLFTKITSLYSGQLTDVSSKIASCNAICNTYSVTKSQIYVDKYCSEGSPVDLNGDGTIETSEKGVICDRRELGVSCPAIEC